MVLAGGLVFYLIDLWFGGVVPHFNSTAHEIGHFLAGKLSGLPVASLNIGSAGGLMFPSFSLFGTKIFIHWSSFMSFVDPGGTPNGFFFAGGPLASILWGAFLAYAARKTSASDSRWLIIATIVLALAAVDSLMARGVLNLLPFDHHSDGSKLLMTLLLS